MVQISTSEFKAGVKIEVDGQPYTIISNEFVKPGKGRSINRVRLKHLINGRTIDRTFTSGDKVDVADVVETEMRMLYKEADGVVFMDETSFEQIKIPENNIGDTSQWLLEDHMYRDHFLQRIACHSRTAYLYGNGHQGNISGS